MSDTDPFEIPSSDIPFSIEGLYDLIMLEIEPELTTVMLPLLNAMYKDQTKQERKKRNKRYKKALKTYNKQFKKAMKIWRDQINALKKSAVSLAQSTAEKADKETLSDIEHSLDAS